MVDRSGQNLRTKSEGIRNWNVARLHKQTFIEMVDENMGRVQLTKNNLSFVDYMMRYMRSPYVDMKETHGQTDSTYK